MFSLFEGKYIFTRFDNLFEMYSVSINTEGCIKVTTTVKVAEIIRLSLG